MNGLSSRKSWLMQILPKLSYSNLPVLFHSYRWRPESKSTELWWLPLYVSLIFASPYQFVSGKSGFKSRSCLVGIELTSRTNWWPSTAILKEYLSDTLSAAQLNFEVNIYQMTTVCNSPWRQCSVPPMNTTYSVWKPFWSAKREVEQWCNEREHHDTFHTTNRTSQSKYTHLLFILSQRQDVGYGVT